MTCPCFRLLLGKPQGELASDPAALPCLLQQLDKDGSRKKGPPGYQVIIKINIIFTLVAKNGLRVLSH